MKKTTAYSILGIAIALIINTQTHAENSHESGDYIIHYNALQTTSLSKKVAQSYGITRSKNRGILNITVLKKTQQVLPGAVTAAISAYAKNLNNQINTLTFREIKEQDAIYYIAEFTINDGESLNFTLNISPENSSAHTIRFDKQFFIH